MHSGHIGSRSAACFAISPAITTPLDLVGALVDLQHLRVAHHPLGREVLQVAVAAQHLDRLGGDAHRRSEAFTFAIAPSLVSRGSSSSTAVAAWKVSARAAATSASMSASLNCTP